MSLFNYDEALKASDGNPKVIEEGVYAGVTSDYIVEANKFSKKMQLAGKIKLNDGGFVFENIDLLNPMGKATAVKKLGGIFKYGLTKKPAFLDAGLSELEEMAKLADLLSAGIPVNVKLEHNKLNDKGYMSYYKSYQPLAEGQEPIDPDTAKPDSIPF